MFTVSPAVRIASTRQNGMFFAEGPKRDLPPVRFDDVHDGGGNQQDEQPDRPELRRRLIDAPWTDIPDEENEGEKAGKK